MTEAGEAEVWPGSTYQKWASFQEILLSMTASTVDEIACILNADPSWDDPRRLARIVESVAGARKSDQD
jgi:hypothetical protein